MSTPYTMRWDVYIPLDAGTLAERKWLAVQQAEDQAADYCIPAAWYAEPDADDPQIIHVTRVCAGQGG